MSTLYVIADLNRSKSIANQALRAWRTDSNPIVLHLNSSDRMQVLLRIIDHHHVTLGCDCFAIDGGDESAVADFNAFLHALRTHERLVGKTPSVIRSFNCRI